MVSHTSIHEPYKIQSMKSKIYKIIEILTCFKCKYVLEEVQGHFILNHDEIKFYHMPKVYMTCDYQICFIYTYV